MAEWQAFWIGPDGTVIDVPPLQHDNVALITVREKGLKSKLKRPNREGLPPLQESTVAFLTMQENGYVRVALYGGDIDIDVGGTKLRFGRVTDAAKKAILGVVTDYLNRI